MKIMYAEFMQLLHSKKSRFGKNHKLGQNSDICHYFKGKKSNFSNRFGSRGFLRFTVSVKPVLTFG